MRPRWYIVQVDLDKSEDGHASGTHFCTFLQRHPNDKDRPDNLARWWPEWRELIWDKNHSSYEYGERILFSPRRQPDLQVFGKFGTDVNLSEASTILAGPFNFQPRDISTAAQLFIPKAAWIDMGRRCRALTITLPTLSNSIRNMIATASSYRLYLRHDDPTKFQLSSLTILSTLFHKTDRTM